MIKPWSVISSFLLIAIKICVADNDNLQDFCPTAIPSSCDPHSLIFINGLPCRNPTNITASDFKTTDLKWAGDTDNLFRSATKIVTAVELPGLNTLGLALGRTDIEVDGIVSLHSHPRAAEILFVSKGVITVGFLDTQNQEFRKMLKEGDVFIVPKGMLHFCINIGYEYATFFSVHNSQNPGIIDLTKNVFGSESQAAQHVKQRFASVPQTEDNYPSSQASASIPHSEL